MGAGGIGAGGAGMGGLAAGPVPMSGSGGGGSGGPATGARGAPSQGSVGGPGGSAKGALPRGPGMGAAGAGEPGVNNAMSGRRGMGGGMMGGPGAGRARGEEDDGYTPAEFLTTIDNLLKVDFDAVIPGHGKVMTKDDVRAYRVRFQTMNDRLQALIRSGVTKEQLATLDQARARLRLADLGWDHSVSTTTWFGGMSRYYDEMAAAR